MRIIAATLLAGALLLAVDASNCDAQLFRSRFNQVTATPQLLLNSRPVMRTLDGSSQQIPLPNRNATPSKPFHFPTQSYFEPRNPVISRILDGKMTHKYRNPAEVDSRYIGGFHQSHFQNLGIPSGDIGIRGNAYNWRTW
jgi:hypothetical protein